MHIDLSANLAGLELPYFWMNASGFLATPPAFARFSGYETGAVVGKTMSLKEIEGNETPNFTQLSEGLYANSIGLSGAGLAGRRDELASCYRSIKRPFIDSVKPQGTPKATATLIKRLTHYAAIELNISCPNVKGGMAIGQDPALTEEYTRACRAVMPAGKPLIVKLTPNVKNMGETALAAVRGGADVLSAVNTFTETGRDYSQARNALGRPPGGLSGPEIRELGLEKVGEIYRAAGDEIPIIGMGGIGSARDAVEYLRRGADAVALGTCLFLDRPMEIPSRCNPRKTVRQFLEDFRDGILHEFEELGVQSPAELKGAHYG